MRLRPSHLFFTILVIGSIGVVSFFLTRNKNHHTNTSAVIQEVNHNNNTTSGRRTLCDYKAPDRHFYLNDIYLERIISGFSKAVLIPVADTSCLPNSFSGMVDFIRFQSPEFVPFGYNHSLELALTKSADTYVMQDFANDKTSLEHLGYSKFDQLQADLKKAYGPEALKGNFLWVSVQPLKITWSRRNYEVPSFHPLAATISKQEVASLLKEKPQVVDVRETIDGDKKLPGAIVYNKFKPDLRMHIAAIGDLRPYAALFKQLDKDKPVIVYDKNEIHFGAYNIATILGSQNFKKIYIFRGGYDEWAGVPILAPNDLNVKIVSGAEIVEMRKKNQLLIIDVRNLGSYKFRHILEAKHATVGMFLNNRAIFSMIEVMPDSIPIIMGENEYDWRPYNIIKNMLKTKPELAKKIYWYRGGMSDARFLEAMRVYLPDSERLKIGPRLVKDYERTRDANPIDGRRGDFKSQEDKL
ncbi:rhodanese-like domain-containing protein [Bdellovibrio sp. NC01]|uniref:rhodanese-like domain-containing protein n=1 Tax=Bdellovibrio sp. NC01 TaxID=2220073 RepID=UPI00115A6815|nr:rhodanese-like domain-containing protein [Bdellovibrio sp. NC01]QDK36506.1 hypothetical protein DOE51_02285 [Bdellovibrio sp. NC01]